MSLIESSKLLEQKVNKAIALINRLRLDNKELNERLLMVTNHNEELQELLNKTSADTAVIEEAITSALESLDELGLDDLGTFGTLDSEELEAAESFTIEGSAADVETFENQEL
ncbi:MAG: hypothetical protein PUH25_04260 [Spirochaetales bacterium]|uniref:hypothetical protein n=1 Tax=Bullifex sp. TaxID=2815808 RepID=UPI002A582700|nr:hypothetical protein [Bullifex sp.]MDD5973826.1 hypothetical protein [Spirochaetales bacterium]MDD7271077.1 hypothetical protein [Spirochaetales bacterium]MDY4067592.1 hypothetical protein [Bullifex sp.]